MHRAYKIQHVGRLADKIVQDLNVKDDREHPCGTNSPTTSCVMCATILPHLKLMLLLEQCA